jgi:hypothetical protein
VRKQQEAVEPGGVPPQGPTWGDLPQDTRVSPSVTKTALARSVIARNPFHARSVKPPAVDPRKLRPWPAERVAAVRDGLPKRYRAMADCGTGLSMRQGEVLALSPDDVEFPGATGGISQYHPEVTAFHCQMAEK